MTDSVIAPGGLEALAERVERGRRRVPPPRHPRTVPEPSSPQLEQPADEAPSTPPKATSARKPKGNANPAPVPGSVAPAPLLEALADAPTTMLGARVRKPLDDLLADAVHAARQHQVRTSKVELVELALLSLVGLDGATLAERVRQFRSETSRYTAPRR